MYYLYHKNNTISQVFMKLYVLSHKENITKFLKVKYYKQNSHSEIRLEIIKNMKGHFTLNFESILSDSYWTKMKVHTNN